MFQILIVEDDDKLRKMICTVLTKNGYNTLDACNGDIALQILDDHYVDLIISDIMMPVTDGIELTKMIRESGIDIPILIITAKDNFNDKKIGFRSGADDYMVKPIDINELILRTEALLRRAQINVERSISFKTTRLDYDALTVTEGEVEHILPAKEFQLLFKLLSNPGKIFTRRQLMDEFWGYSSETDERTVDVHINRLRIRFKDNKDFELQTVRGLGYKAVK